MAGPALLLLLLAVASPASAADLSLLWTAPGENGPSGTVAGYDLRYSSTPIAGDTLNWWASASQAVGEPSPSAPGATESYNLTGLTDEVDYSMLLRSYDEAGNLSPFSNLLILTVSDTSGSEPEPLVISSVSVDSVSGNAAQVKWQTSEDAYGFVRYGTDPDSYGLIASSIGTVTSSHAANLIGLNTGETIHFQVVSHIDTRRDSTADASFVAVNLPPAAPTGLTPISGAGYVGLLWAANDDPDIASYNIYWKSTPAGEDLGLLDEDFESGATGTDPTGWIDPSNRFGAVDFPGHGRVYEADPGGSSSIAYFDPGGEAGDFGDIDFRGNFRLTQNAASGFVLRRAGEGSEELYYLVRFSDSAPLTLDRSGDATVSQAIGSESITPDADRWYSWHVTAWNDGGEVRLGCAIWPEEESEPEKMQVWGLGDGSATSPIGNIGLYSAGNGKSWFDNISLTALPPVGNRMERGIFTSWIHPFLSADSLYHYWIEAIDTGGERSRLSLPASAQPSPADTTDTAAPAVVNDLAAEPGSQAGSIDLTWTASGDDGASGTASVYDLRWSTSPLNESNFGQGTSINTGLPLIAGSAESLTAAGFALGSTYHFALRVGDESGNQSPLSNGATATVGADTQGPILMAIHASPVSDHQATVNWTTDEPGNGTVFFGLSTNYERGSVSNQVLGTTHQFTLSNLVANTLYHYQVRSSDELGNVTISGDLTFLTLEEVAPPLIAIEDLYIESISDSDAVVSFTTTPPSEGYIDYGLGASYGSLASSGAFASSHTIRLLHLESGELYHFRARAQAAGIDTVTTGDRVLMTSSSETPDETPPVLSTILVDSVSSNGAWITWQTDEGSISRVEYGLDDQYGLATSLGELFTFSHEVVLAGLNSETTFHFRVYAEDLHGNSTYSGDATFTTTEVPVDGQGPVISEVAVVEIAESTATIVWETDEPGDGQVEYGTQLPYDNATLLNDSLLINHRVTLNNLAAGTVHHFRILSRDQWGNLTWSEDYPFTTASVEDTTGEPDDTPPVISGVVLSEASPTGITVTWNTDEVAFGQVEYGLSVDYGTLTSPEESPGTAHSIRIDGLSAGVVFHFRVHSTDESDNESASGDRTFILSIDEDVVPPEIVEVTVLDITGTSARVAWRTDEPAEGQVEFGLNSAYDFATLVDTACVVEHEVLLENLTVSESYHFRVVSRDRAGNVSFSDDLVLVTAGEIDSIGPVLSSIGLIEVEDGVVQVLWNSDEQCRGQVEYGLDSSLTSSTIMSAQFQTNHFFQIDGLATGRLFLFRAVCRDLSGNISRSDLYSVWVGEAPDSTGPSFAGQVIAVPGISEAEITWTTDEPSDSRVEFGEESNVYDRSSPLDLTRVTVHRIIINGLDAEVEYHFRVISRDMSGNLSMLENLAFTTLPDTSRKVPALTWVDASKREEEIAILEWGTDIPSMGQIEYGGDTLFAHATSVTGEYVTSHAETILGLSPGRLYYFRIRGTGESGAFFTSSVDTFRTRIDLIPPPPPIAVIASERSGGIDIRWNPDPSESPAALEVNRRFLPGGSWKLIDQITGTETSYSEDLTGLNLKGFSTAQYVLFLFDSYGNKTVSDTVDVELALNFTPVISRFVLEPNRPNPFNPYTILPFRLPDGQESYRVRVTIYDINGRFLIELADEMRPPGAYTDVSWDGYDFRGNRVGSGVYFYRVDAGSFSDTRRMVLVR